MNNKTPTSCRIVQNGWQHRTVGRCVRTKMGSLPYRHRLTFSDWCWYWASTCIYSLLLFKRRSWPVTFGGRGWSWNGICKLSAWLPGAIYPLWDFKKGLRGGECRWKLPADEGSAFVTCSVILCINGRDNKPFYYVFFNEHVA